MRLGPGWWFLDGSPLGSTQGSDALRLALRKAGPHQLSLLDERGMTAQVVFRLLD